VLEPAGEALLAFVRGEESLEAEVGSLLVAEFLYLIRATLGKAP